MLENQDREHIANKVGKDAINSSLKEFEMHFPLEHGGEGSLPIKPFNYEDSWVETKYDAVGNKVFSQLILRIKCLTYKKINTCHPGITYWNNGHETNCIMHSFKEDVSISESYNNIKQAFIKMIKEHTLYQPVKFKPAKKIKKVSEDSNLLLLL